MEVEVLSLTHEEISNILEIANYGNDNIAIQRPKECNHLVSPKSQFGSDRWADILLGGGYIVVWDLNADADSLSDQLSGRAIAYDLGDRSIGYRLSLGDLLRACAADMKTALDVISGEGDVNDAYNLVQLAIFGEVIYG